MTFKEINDKLTIKTIISIFFLSQRDFSIFSATARGPAPPLVVTSSAIKYNQQTKDKVWQMSRSDILSNSWRQ